MRYISSVTPEKNSVTVDASRLFGIPAGTEYISVSVTYKGTGNADGRIFVNGVAVPLDGTESMKHYAPPYIFTFRCEPEASGMGEGALEVRFIPHGAGVSPRPAGEPDMTIYLSDGDVRNFQEYPNESVNTRGSLDSFMLIRTNPKLTGNVKLVVDSSGAVFMDTFKVTSVLNNRVYRKYPVSSDGNYPMDVKTVFSRLPLGELFKTPADSLNPHKFYKDQSKQYVTDYEYGAETNLDDMYPENMKILAPLHIGKNVPDFFCIFSNAEIYNSDTYKSSDFDDTEKFTDMLRRSRVVKIFDLRSYTAAGQYIRNYAASVDGILHGSCHLQFIEQDNDRDSENYRQGSNSWRGIDVARGIITNKIESSYFADNVLSSGDAVQERFNNYVINGYERNNVLYPYILNIEFMFDDDEALEFSMQRYFGLYLTSSEFMNYRCIVTDYESGNGIVRKLDADDREINDSTLFASIFQERFLDRIIFMVTNNAATRVRSRDDVKDFINGNVLDNPDGNVADVRAEDTEWRDGDRSFITLSFPQPVRYGEHLRFVAFNVFSETSGKYEDICLEIVATNDERLLQEDGFIYPYVNTCDPDMFVHGDDPDPDATADPNIYRLSFYTQSLTEPAVPATVSEQIARICACIRKFSSFIRVTSVSEDTIGIVSSEENVYFQHIAAPNRNEPPHLEKAYVTTDDGGNYVINYTSVGGGINKLPYESYVSTLYRELKAVRENVAFPSLDVSAYSLDNSFYTQNDASCVTNFVEYENPENAVTDTIRYFSRIHDTLMRPLSPDTRNYDRTFGVFSLFGFEALGWRLSNIIRFKRPAEFSNPMTVYDDLQGILKNIRHPLVRTADGTFETMLTSEIAGCYLTDNTFLNMDFENLHVHTQKLVEKREERHTVISPYNTDACIADFHTRPFLHNYTISVFNTERAQLCVMGIIPVRDIDMSVNVTDERTVSDTRTFNIPAGTVIDLSGNDDAVIFRDTLYRIESGSFKEVNVKKFIICGDDMYYTTGENEEVSRGKFFGGILTVASDMLVTVLDGDAHQKYSYTSSSPSQSDENFFTYRDSIATSGLDIPVVPMTNCFWESNGQYLDGTSVLDTDAVTSPYDVEGHFTEVSKVPDGTSVPGGTGSFFKTPEGILTFREAILGGTLRNAIKKLVFSGHPVRTAVGYYNSYIQSLEFIYYGIKFSLKFDPEYYNRNLRIGEYNNFDVYFINEYMPAARNEVYISADEQIMLFVNHTYDVTVPFGRCASVHGIDGDISETVPYSVADTSYEIRTDTICGFSDTLIAGRNEGEGILGGRDGAFFVQEDYAHGKTAGNPDVKPHYITFPVRDDSSDVFNVKDSSVGILRVRSGEYVVDLFSNAPADASETEDYSGRASTPRILMYEDAAPEDGRSTARKVSDYAQIFSGNLDCHVIYNGVVTDISVTESYRPLTIDTKVPRRVKFNFGYFRPVFYDIVEFHTNDYDLADAAGVSLLMAGTRVKTIRRIGSYTENKVFETTAEFSVRKNYFFDTNRSVLSSNWDNGFYRKYTSQDAYGTKGGYFSGVEHKSFFGSKCLVIRSGFITLDDFTSSRINPKTEYLDSSYNVYSENRRQCRITINITQSIYSLFDTDETFAKNWENGDGWSDTDTARGNYIQNTITRIFNTQRRREVTLYVRSNGTEQADVMFSPDADGYSDGWERMDDFDAETRIENNDMILRVTFALERGVTVHPQIKIYR